MATTYQWKISQLEYYPVKADLQKVVHVIHWILMGTDGQYSSSAYGSQFINTDSINPENYVPFENLSEQTVIEWLEGAMGAERILELQTVVQDNINNQINPSNVLAPAPWS